MALIPLKDSATITKVNGADPWDGASNGASVTHKCRIDEGTKLVRNQNGEEVVSNTQILFDRIVAVAYSDDVSWTDASGVLRKRKPTAIGVIKDIASKPLFTEVYV